jgi:hypothetical protein
MSGTWSPAGGTVSGAAGIWASAAAVAGSCTAPFDFRLGCASTAGAAGRGVGLAVGRPASGGGVAGRDVSRSDAVVEGSGAAPGRRGARPSGAWRREP